MNRRSFLGAATSFAAISAMPRFTYAQGSQAKKFSMHFAPHPGMFNSSAGSDLIDQIKFAHDQGFTAWEDNGLPGRSPQMQEKIGTTLDQLGMKMGVFVAYGNFDQPVFVGRDDSGRQEVLKKMEAAVEIAKRVNAKWFTVVPGSVDQQHADQKKWNRYGGARLAPGYQTANAIELLKRCSAILEPHKLVMVLEPLNWKANHGGVFLQRSDQAFAICKAVNSPSCKILFDIYHQQITEGNLIPNIDACWDEIAYFQSGDNPGRKEPGTGEINYANVFKHIQQKSKVTKREFVIGMEHGNSMGGAEGDKAVIEAYRKVDPV